MTNKEIILENKGAVAVALQLASDLGEALILTRASVNGNALNKAIYAKENNPTDCAEIMRQANLQGVELNHAITFTASVTRMLLRVSTGEKSREWL